MADNRIVQHYDNVVETYIESPFYLKKEYTDFLLSFIKPLTLGKTVLDIGCGTCHFSELLDAKKLICVDPSKEMLFQRPLLKNQEKLVSDGITFLKNTRSQYEIILLKECLHHFSDKDKLILLKDCHENANATLIVIRPNDNQYPWFKQAQDIFENLSVNVSSLINILEELNFSFIKKELIVPIKIPSQQWHKMIASRFWSNLSQISNLELKNAVDDLKLRQEKEIFFEDKIILLIATPK